MQGKAKIHAPPMGMGARRCLLFLATLLVGGALLSALAGSHAYGQTPSARDTHAPQNIEARYGASGGTARDRNENERLRHYLRSASERKIRNFSLRYALENLETFGKTRLSENFSLHSSLGWADENRLQGELRFVLPISAREGRATFLQPGVVLWRGNDPLLKGDDDRYDFSLGLVRRQVLGLGGARRTMRQAMRRQKTRAKKSPPSLLACKRCAGSTCFMTAGVTAIAVRAWG